MYFKGDIIITDPCYVVKKYNYGFGPQWSDYMKHKSADEYPSWDDFMVDCRRLEAAQEEWMKSHPDDWEVCNYGENMDLLGFTRFLVSDTGYGDWSCHTFEAGTNKVLGQFCADAGKVGVFLLDEVLKYNPEFDDHINEPWAVTLIGDFDGEIDIDTDTHCTINERWEDAENEDESRDEEFSGAVVSVVGKGNVNFYTRQTGF